MLVLPCTSVILTPGSLARVPGSSARVIPPLVQSKQLLFPKPESHLTNLPKVETRFDRQRKKLHAFHGADEPYPPNGDTLIFNSLKGTIMTSSSAAHDIMKHRRGVHNSYCRRIARARQDHNGSNGFSAKQELLHEYQEMVEPLSAAVRRQMETVTKAYHEMQTLPMRRAGQREWAEQVWSKFISPLNRENMEYGLLWFTDLNSAR